MSNQESSSYPDVLKHITPETVQNVGALQIAMTTRPRVIRAGKPFEVLIVLQNTVDAPVDVNLSLQIPDKDAKGKKDRFIAGKTNILVGLQPAEVGYVSLPLSSLPDAAPGNGYNVSVSLQVKTLEKGETIRDQQSNALDVQQLPEAAREEIEKLSTLHFVTNRQRSLRGTILATNFILLPGKVGAPLRLEPNWRSLWSLELQDDHDLLLDKYRDQIRQNVLPKLRSKALFAPLLEKTKAYFEKAGYALSEIEAIIVTKLLVLILEYSNASRTSHDVLEAGSFNLEGRVAEKREHIDMSGALPEWLIKYLKIISKDERFATVPVKAIPHFAYEELLLDAMSHSFNLIEKNTGEDMGTPEEMQQYANAVVEKLKAGRDVAFADVYMPLIIGGLVKFDDMIIPGEQFSDHLEAMADLLENRSSEHTDDNNIIFQMTQSIMEPALKSYGVMIDRW